MVNNIGPKEILDPGGGDLIVPEYIYDDSWGGVVERILDPEGTWVSSISRPTWYEMDVDEEYDQYIKPGATGSTGESSSGGEPLPEFKNKLTDTQLEITMDIAENIGAGPGADQWTTSDVLDATNATTSEDTVRSAAKQLREHNWAEQTDRDANGSKIHRLTEDPRGQVSADGGFRDEYRLDHDWDLVLENFENRDDIFAYSRNDEIEPDGYPDWFCYNQREHIVAMFETTKEFAETILKIHEKRSELDERWDTKPFRENDLKEIRDELGVLRRHFRDLHGYVRNLTLVFLDNCMKWKSMYKKVSGDDAKNIFMSSRRPEELKSGDNGRKGFLHALSIAINKGHLEGLIERDPQDDESNHRITEYIYEAERNVGYYLEMMWEIAEQLIGDMSRVTQRNPSEEDDESPSDETETESDEVPSRDELDTGVSLVLSCLEHADGPISWEELKDDFNERASNERRPTTIFMYLKNAHRWCLDSDSKLYGIRVEDETKGTGKDPDVQIELIDEPPRQDFFDRHPDVRDWPQNRDLTAVMN